MPIVLPREDGGPHKCCQCNRAKRENEFFCGPNMWHVHAWTCRHTTTYECPECYVSKPRVGCPECGLQEEYT